MKVCNIINSISYVDFINKLNSLTNNLLYNQKDGYFSLKSSDAIFNFEKLLKSFEYEISFMLEKNHFENVDKIIELKKIDFIEKATKYRNSQIKVWLSEVFDIFLNNSLFEISIDKYCFYKEKNNVLKLIDWFSEINQFDEKQINSIKTKIEEKFNIALNSKDDDFILKNKLKKTDIKTFFELWNMVLSSTNDFLELDLGLKSNLLIDDDIKLFQGMQKKLATYHKTSLKDEIILINSSINLMEFKNEEEKYLYVKNVLNDFYEFTYKNKNINEEDKIKIIKRRIALQKDKEKTSSGYFEKLLLL